MRLVALAAMMVTALIGIVAVAYAVSPTRHTCSDRR